jgi:hypothetical protein
MFDLSTFTLREVTELGALLRRAGDGARSMEETAGRVARILHEDRVDPATGVRDGSLVRSFETHCYDRLDVEKPDANHIGFSSGSGVRSTFPFELPECPV